MWSLMDSSVPRIPTRFAMNVVRLVLQAVRVPRETIRRHKK